MHGICSKLYRNTPGRTIEIISSISEAAAYCPAEADAEPRQ
ncbi:hypothetical protein T05_7937 [Trichinella murrelli]|uniref:Uncharacterized protein n=1 Tax=Trichinella murrelli TaxID=144512 RepID=A0A0V0SWP2_9BILA|nr:hypothetical protein T05_7937 [Trichinella murrelli]